MNTRSRSTFRFLVPVVAAVAGLLAATAVATSRGSELPGQRDNLPGLIADRQASLTRLERQAQGIRAQVDDATAQSAAGSKRVQTARSQGAALARATGLSPVSGPGVTVALDDAPRSTRSRPLPAGVPPPTPDDLVVHQQDVQAALNGLRSGGATALAVMGQRVIATTAVRCVGNTLLVNGQVYSPPFVLQAIGEPGRLRAGLEAEPDVQIYQQYVAAYGLGFDVTTRDSLKLPAYTGAVGLTAARPLTH